MTNYFKLQIRTLQNALEISQVASTVRSKNREKSVNGNTFNTIAGMSAKSLLINILSALRTILLVILAFFLFSPFYQLIPKPIIVFLFLLPLWLTLSQKLRLTIQCYGEHVKRVERMGLNVRFSFNNCHLDKR
jgi:hypothetical protein